MRSLAQLTSFPIKSCAPSHLAEAEVGPLGLHGDRRWMLVDSSARFVSGRKVPSLALVAVVHLDGGLRVCVGGSSAELMLLSSGTRRVVQVWGDTVDALDCGDEAARWFSDYCGMAVRLVEFDALSRRLVDPDHAEPGDQVAFADGYPILLLSQASVDALSERVGRPMSVWRFRPNLVVDGCAPHEEDLWRRIRIGDVLLDVVKPCTRCVFTTVDPDTGCFDADGEPLRTLKTYRRLGSGICFGQNVIPRSGGRIRVGDAVEVLEWAARGDSGALGGSA